MKTDSTRRACSAVLVLGALLATVSASGASQGIQKNTSTNPANTSMLSTQLPPSVQEQLDQFALLERALPGDYQCTVLKLNQAMLNASKGSVTLNTAAGQKLLALTKQSSPSPLYLKNFKTTLEQALSAPVNPKNAGQWQLVDFYDGVFFGYLAPASSDAPVNILGIGSTQNNQFRAFILRLTKKGGSATSAQLTMDLYGADCKFLSHQKAAGIKPGTVGAKPAGITTRL